MNENYKLQARGDKSDYELYFSGMDSSMQQKIALTTAHFPTVGVIADMGSGSGKGTFDLAELYKNLELIGIDINAEMVNYASSKYQSDNLKFALGDVADKLYPDHSFSGILNSSVLHHVTSFNNYDLAQIDRTLDNQTAQLKLGGICIIRDFVVPDRAEELITLSLPADDGLDEGEIAGLSTASLFKVFARDFRGSLNRNKSVPHRELLRDQPQHYRHFETSLRYATEFVLRKDYRQSWDTELIEEYTYYSQSQFENAYRERGLRIIISMPIWNSWIVANRFIGKFKLTDTNGINIPYPGTNYLIVGEKITATEGIQLSQRTVSNNKEPASFLKLNAYRNKKDHTIYELVERPNQTIDLLPWFETNEGQLFVIAKKDFPRPIINAEPKINLNKANYSGYLTGPISAIKEDANESVQAAIKRVLKERGNIHSEEIQAISEAQTYYTSPGGIDEKVEAYLVRLNGYEKPAQKVNNYTTFTSSGVVRELDALQVLRACAVGGMFEARLEINIYRLLHSIAKSPGAWIGASILPEIKDQVIAENQKWTASEKSDLKLDRRNAFEPMGPISFESNHFLELFRGEFIEENSASEVIASGELEYVLPKNLSKNTAAVIPFFQTEGEIYVGLELRDLPAPQRFSGNSSILCAPAWRLPRDIEHKFDIEPFLNEKLATEFNSTTLNIWELGGSYFTSTGVTPECVYPFCAEVSLYDLDSTQLHYHLLSDLLENTNLLVDAHLLIVIHRLAHALDKI